MNDHRIFYDPARRQYSIKGWVVYAEQLHLRFTGEEIARLEGVLRQMSSQEVRQFLNDRGVLTAHRFPMEDGPNWAPKLNDQGVVDYLVGVAQQAKEARHG